MVSKITYCTTDFRNKRNDMSNSEYFEINSTETVLRFENNIRTKPYAYVSYTFRNRITSTTTSDYRRLEPFASVNNANCLFEITKLSSAQCANRQFQF